VKQKKVSAGVLIVDPVTRALLAQHPTGSKFFDWKYNQKTSKRGSLDIPKGNLNPDEAPADAAVRELFEETGIALDPSELTPLGIFEYTDAKDLYLFYVEKKVNLEALHCDSYFENKEGKLLPECNGWAKLTELELDMLYPKLERVVRNALRGKL
jgi:8-oxo-dGTP pyrophosphatase MutT (NUDIX family)